MRRPLARLRLPFVLALGLATSCASTGTSPDGTTPARADADGVVRYPIRLERGWEPGARHRVEVDEVRTQTQTIRHQGQVMEERTSTKRIVFVADVTVLEVDVRREATHLTYRVASCMLTEDGQTTELVPAGTTLEVFTAADADRARILRDGQPIDDALRAPLASVLTVRSSSEASDEDAVFGSARPRAVGESWTPDRESFARAMNEEAPFAIDPARVSATSRVESRGIVSGTSGLGIAVDVEVDQPRLTELPEDIRVRRSHATLRLDGFFPDDVSLPRLRSHTATRFELVADVRSDRATFEMELTLLTESHETLTPLP